MRYNVLMVGVQLAYTILFIISQASFNNGMNPFVYVTYRHFLGGVILLPFAFFIERESRPKLILRLFLEIFVLSFLGVTLTLNLFFLSMKYTNPTFSACMINTIASLTFIIALALRMETIDFRSLRGVAKIGGAVVSLGGVLVMTLYKGPSLKNVGHAPFHLKGQINLQENWLKGSLLTVASCTTWSMWYIMQAYTLRRYPAQLSLATWMNLVGGAQSAIFTAIVQHDRAAWTIGLDIDLWSTLYGAIVISGLVYYLQLYCTEVRGPVFVTMFSPLATLLVAVLSYFALGEKLHVGSIIGGVIVVIGLYLLLWGKEHDAVAQTEPEPKETGDELRENDLRGDV